jgi:hypothetical protein
MSRRAKVAIVTPVVAGVIGLLGTITAILVRRWRQGRDIVDNIITEEEG